MKQPVRAALVIGLLVALILGAVHAGARFFHLETAAAHLISSPSTTTTRMVPNKWLYVFILAGALGVALLTLASKRRDRIGWLVAALGGGVGSVPWVLSSL